MPGIPISRPAGVCGGGVQQRDGAAHLTVSVAWSLLYFLRDFALGGVAGALVKTATVPLERVKLILQVHRDANKQMLLQNSEKFDGFLDCCKLKDQDFASFWRGNWASLVRYLTLQAISNWPPRTDLKRRGQGGELLALLRRQHGIGVFVTGATSISVVYPLNLARMRLGADVTTHEREFTGMWDCLSRIYEHDGIVGLYRGFCVAIVGSTVYRSVHFIKREK